MKKVAIIGTEGIPAHYGGFETLAENLVYKRSKSVVYSVFCSSKNMHTAIRKLNGCTLYYLRFDSHGMQSVLYDMYSMWRARKGFDTLLILGVSGCLFLPFLRFFTNAKIVVNIDGMEYRRAKWGKAARNFLKLSERIAVKFSDEVIADNKAIAEYVQKIYGKESSLIAYGGDYRFLNVSEEYQMELLKRYGISYDHFALSICRIVPDNNIEMILQAFAETPEKNIVILGNWLVSEYAQRLREEYGDKPNILLLDANFDKYVLYTLRNNCSMYIHGHTAGGTNPTLVEQMFYGKPILAYNVIYNIYTTDNKADYFSDVESLKKLLVSNKSDGAMLKKCAQQTYRWRDIVKQYEALY